MGPQASPMSSCQTSGPGCRFILCLRKTFGFPDVPRVGPSRKTRSSDYATARSSFSRIRGFTDCEDETFREWILTELPAGDPEGKPRKGIGRLVKVTLELTDTAVLHELGARLERRRIDANFTQAQLADIARASWDSALTCQGSQIVTSTARCARR